MVKDIKVSPYTFDGEEKNVNSPNEKLRNDEKTKSLRFSHFFDRTTLHGWKYLV